MYSSTNNDCINLFETFCWCHYFISFNDFEWSGIKQKEPKIFLYGREEENCFEIVQSYLCSVQFWSWNLPGIIHSVLKNAPSNSLQPCRGCVMFGRLLHYIGDILSDSKFSSENYENIPHSKDHSTSWKCGKSSTYTTAHYRCTVSVQLTTTFTYSLNPSLVKVRYGIWRCDKIGWISLSDPTG